MINSNFSVDKFEHLLSVELNDKHKLGISLENIKKKPVTMMFHGKNNFVEVFGESKCKAIYCPSQKKGDEKVGECLHSGHLRSTVNEEHFEENRQV